MKMRHVLKNVAENNFQKYSSFEAVKMSSVNKYFTDIQKTMSEENYDEFRSAIEKEVTFKMQSMYNEGFVDGVKSLICALIS